MITKLLNLTFAFFLAIGIYAQSEFPYSIAIEPTSINGLDGLHSYVYGQHDGKWVVIGGRLDGLHARQPFNAFPASQNNTNIFVVNPETEEVWTASINNLSTGLKEQLQGTNFQFYQDGESLIIIGGYAYSTSEGDHTTFPYLTIANVPDLIENIINGNSISGDFQQIMDNAFAVTGGYLGKIGEEFQLVGGHRFEGRYNPMNMPSFIQTYTNAIRKFALENNGGTWSFSNYSEITDPVHLHRRDYNLLPQIFPDGEFGYTMYSGVFQINQDLPFLYPVNITADGFTPINDFNQYLCNYHSAHIALHDAESNSMHNLFFGGISQYYYENEEMVQDDNVPFVKTISRVSRNADGSMEEMRFPVEMPGYFGAGAELIFNPELPVAAHDIVELSEINSDSFLLGYIFGGIESQYLNPFTFNNTETTSANENVFKVYLIKNGTTDAKEELLPGYHNFNISVSPNPVDSNVFRVTIDAPESGLLEIFLSDVSGKLLLNETMDGFPTGKNTIEVEMEDQAKGMTFLTVMLNGKYSDSSTLIFK